MGSVCVNVRCGFREKSERRDCPKCGWLMLDGPLPETGSLAPPPKVRNPLQIAAIGGAGFVLFFGAIGMLAGSYASADPVASHRPVAAAPVAMPAPVVDAPVAPAPVAEPVVAAAPAKPVVAPKAAVAKAVTKKKAPAKKTAAKKTVAKKAPAKKPTNVARR